MKVIAPNGAVTPAQVAALRVHKAEIIRLLSAANANDADLRDQFEERAAFLEYCCNLSRADAERQAWDEVMEPPAQPEPAYVGHDWGGNDPFQRFRRCPDLLQTHGDAP